jgi:hypothetical protein
MVAFFLRNPDDTRKKEAKFWKVCIPMVAPLKIRGFQDFREGGGRD